MLSKLKRYVKNVRIRNTGIQTNTHTSVGRNNFTIQKFWVIYCPLQQEEFRYGRPALPLHFCTAPATNDALITSCDELLYSISISVRVLCYQLPCRNSFHFAIVFKFLVSTIWLQRWKQMTIALPCMPQRIHNHFRVVLSNQTASEYIFWPLIAYNFLFTLTAPITKDILGWADNPFH
jgi:hypothetical protein